ncbi:MAG TPA: tetratricopeptide repeat protein [Puia sp.]|nr:tetratricopeptide repeat protein [Puia sp.]
MKNVFVLLVCFSFFVVAYSQDNSKPASQQDLQILTQNIDSAKLLRETATDACKCIDSISLINKNTKEISADIKKCIDKQVTVYEIGVKLLSSLKTTKKDVSISINPDPNSTEYKKYYYDIERWLTDSCKALRNAVGSNNKESDYSMSKDPASAGQYQKGVDFMKAGNYAEALPYFKKAVEIDSLFAFAWDNVGLCYRRIGNLDEAIKAYEKSLSIDPKGQMPLQNLAIVYEYKKEYDKELEAYKKLQSIYPDDPEVFYGLGRIYTLFKKDPEKGLDNFCKAYTMYIKINSPLRADAEKNIISIFNQMKKDGKEDMFNKILADNHINQQKN